VVNRKCGGLRVIRELLIEEELCCKASGYPGNQFDFFISAMQNRKLVNKDNKKESW
jgi:hypothetical protein